MQNNSSAHDTTSINPDEINTFERIALEWWDEQGPFKPLHQINPHRLQYIRQSICQFYGTESEKIGALDGLSILDIGCGGGLICEPLKRMGAELVSGIDAGEKNIEAAKIHAQDSGLDIEYNAIPAEAFVNERAGHYDVVLALEILEHVNNPDEFVALVQKFVKPGGLVIFSTLNRTLKSLAFGKIAAEYVLGLVPAGTHDWKKFIKPSELARWARAAGGEMFDTHGLVYDLRAGAFALHPSNLDINYFMCVKMPERAGL